MAISGKKTFAQVQSELLALPLGEYLVLDIVKIIQQCDTLPKKSIDSFVAAFYEKEDGESLYDLNNIWVDLNYQRKLKLKNLLNNLKSHKGYSKEKAGHVDIAIRPNGKAFVWDGFRRTVMALLCGMEKIAVSVYKHKRDRDCRKYEAELFLARNAKNESMGANEIFFARLAKGEDEAIKMNTVLTRANINVCGLKPGGKNMGGFAFVEKSLGYHERMDGEVVNKHISDDDFVFASQLIQSAWSKDPSIGAYLVSGLANTRAILRADSNSDYDDTDIEEAITKYASSHKQADLSDNRVSNKPLQSITYNILKYAMKLNGKSKKLSGLNSDEIDIIEDNE
jgi:hypothetical protein